MVDSGPFLIGASTEVLKDNIAFSTSGDVKLSDRIVGINTHISVGSNNQPVE